MHVTEAVRANVRRGRLLLRAPERWQSGRMRRFAKPLYGLTPVPRVRIPPSPPCSLDCRENAPFFCESRRKCPHFAMTPRQTVTERVDCLLLTAFLWSRLIEL